MQNIPLTKHEMTNKESVALLENATQQQAFWVNPIMFIGAFSGLNLTRGAYGLM